MNESRKTELLMQARKASAGAYAPYSQFKVGAAVLDAEGRVHFGCNVENASYGLTSCAERNALAAARVAGASDIKAIAIYVEGDRLFEPCGACRQVMLELMPSTAPVYSGCEGADRSWTVGELLPEPFRLTES